MIADTLEVGTVRPVGAPPERDCVDWQVRFAPGRKTGEREFKLVQCEGVLRSVYCPRAESLAVGDALTGREYPLTPELVKLLRGKPVIDVGSHCGGTAAYFEEMLQPSQMICVEPHPVAFEYLKENVQQPAGRPVLLINAAATSTNGTSEYFCRDKIYSSGLYQYVEHDETPIPDTPIKVDILAGDALIKTIEGEIGVLKIDAERSELNIMHSMGKRDLERRAVIFVEYHDEDTRRMIDQLLRGFTLFHSHTVPYVQQGTLGYLNNRFEIPCPQ